MSRSALSNRLERHMPLTAEERDALDWAERREHRIPAGGRLIEQDDEGATLWIVQQGWLHASVEIPNGARQILRFHYAGDVMGVSSIAWAWSSNTLTAVSDCIVSELPKAALGRLFKAQPRLAGLLYAVSAAEYVAMGDRLTSMGRTGALERLATLFLDIRARLRVTAGGVIDSFDLPLTQQDIGDAVGLTKVHVSRTLGEMERQGLIARNGKRVKILDEPRMIQLTGFVDRYGVIDTSWLPMAA
jgi:CRP/FNR family transcriptional regulator, anaerobic regulatory protein